MTPENKEITNAIDVQKTNLTNLSRLTQNTINLINDAAFPGSHASVIMECLQWLNAIKTDIEKQLSVFDAPTPVKEAVATV